MPADLVLAIKECLNAKGCLLVPLSGIIKILWWWGVAADGWHFFGVINSFKNVAGWLCPPPVAILYAGEN